MAITGQGYQRPSYEELLDAKIELAQELFGTDIDTSDASILGKIILPWQMRRKHTKKTK